MTVIDSVDALIERNEGRRYSCYDDKHPDRILKAGDHCEGTPTIGVGCTGPGIVPGVVWTEAQIDAAKAARIALATRQAGMDLGLDCWSKLSSVRQAVLIDVAYEVGGVGLSKFRHMLTSIRLGDWMGAHDELLHSKLAESQAPDREIRNAAMLLTGKWPAVG